MKQLQRSIAALAACAFLAACGGQGEGASTTGRLGVSDDSTLRVTSSLWIYNDGLVGGWADWTGTWSLVDIANSSPVFWGSRSISVTFAPWSGFLLHNTSAVSTAGFGYLDFVANGGETAGANIVAFTTFSGVSGPHISVGSYCAAGNIPANAWTRCRVPLSVLQADNASIDGVTLRFEGTDPMPPVD